jgi:membrane associated rhomboid family serine protease
MGLSDRFYMRDTYHAPRVATRLIFVLLGAYLLQCILLFYGDFDISDNLALSVDGLRHGKVWQLISFQFLHSCPWPFHVLFNCLGLWFFGRPVEEIVGAKKFLVLYFASGLAGGFLQVLTTVALPRHLDVPVVGASAGVCGLVAIFCSIHPMEEIRTWIYFFPITIRARFFLIGLIAISVFGTIVPFFGAIAHAAHLGGILLGLGYLRFGHRIEGDLPGWLSWLWRPKARTAVPGSRAKNSPWRGARTQPEPASEYISQEVDPILDKISAHGLGSLTDKERKTLEAARQRMASRKRG